MLPGSIPLISIVAFSLDQSRADNSNEIPFVRADDEVIIPEVILDREMDKLRSKVEGANEPSLALAAMKIICFSIFARELGIEFDDSQINQLHKVTLIELRSKKIIR